MDGQTEHYKAPTEWDQNKAPTEWDPNKHHVSNVEYMQEEPNWKNYLKIDYISTFDYM